MGDPNLHHQFGDDFYLDAIKSKHLSALMDGELSDDEWAHLASELDAEADADHTVLVTAWHRYHLIGDVIRSNRVLDSDFQAQDAISFAKKVTTQLHPSIPITPVAPAVAPVAQPGTRSPAANDAAFEWRKWAMAASMAVLGVGSWHYLSAITQPTSPSFPLHATQQLATPPESTVVVKTTQGAVVRDERLEAWMQAHRQHGGGAALQAPAGFLRAATSDATHKP